MDTIRSYRVLEIALFDLLGSFLGAWLLDNYYLKLDAKQQTIYYLSVIPIGILVHLITGQNTTLNKKLFSPEFNVHKVIVALIIISIIFNLLK